MLVCLLTTTLRDAPLHRFPVPANEGTGLHKPSQVMIDKIMAVPRHRCGVPIGRVDDTALLAIGRRLAFAVGIAD